MRKVIIAFISIFITVAALLIILLILSISRGGGAFGGGGMNLVNTQKVNLKDITSLNIRYNSEDITFYTSDSEELVFKEYMNYKPKKEDLSQIEINGNQLSIHDGREFTNFSIWPCIKNHKVEIYLPEGYSNSLNVTSSSGNIHSSTVLKLSGLNAKSTSGNIRFGEVYADRINADASSGNINFELAQGDRQFSATSGNIKVMGGSGDSQFQASSGNITIENASGYLDVSSSSGEIRVSSQAGGGRLKASSGNIDLELASLTDNLDLHASSGNVNLDLTGDTSFRFTADASSGDIRTFFDDNLSYSKRGNSAHGDVGSNPVYEINIETNSGNIRVSD
jgi:DUF4097 and DUF4098 domain-containing protein YvlB